MSLIEEALKRAKRDGLTQDASRTRPVPAAHAPRVVEPSIAPAGRLAARLAARPQLKIDREMLRAAGLAPQRSAERRLTSEYRALKRGLLAFMGRRGASPESNNSIMVASAMPGEGKTFTALNLAVSLAAERDWTVVLVDADSAKHHLSTVLGIDAERGLLDVLSDTRLSFADVMYRTAVPGLHVVAAGQASEASTELIASARMTQALQDLLREEPGAIVVFDSSPLLLTTDSRALADAVGQVLLVVRADSTPRASVMEAIAALGDGHQIGLVLNEYQGTALQQSYYEDNEATRAASAS
ncbi:MAG TPA: AAA family ATPase [Steroidobacteraceae bacterium]|nr:AAA family ATPase [Steroidobacteraceae bacterium]